MDPLPPSTKRHSRRAPKGATSTIRSSHHSHQHHHNPPTLAQRRARSRELYNRSRSVDRAKPYDPAVELERYGLAYALRDALFAWGFARGSFHKEFGSRECIYVKELPGVTNLYVVVYTTIQYHECRAKDTDAIRVVGMYETRGGEQRPLTKTEKVLRTGSIQSIVKRLGERVARVEAKLTRDDALTRHACPACGAPRFLSKKGNRVCAELCFKK